MIDQTLALAQYEITKLREKYNMKPSETAGIDNLLDAYEEATGNNLGSPEEYEQWVKAHESGTDYP